MLSNPHLRKVTLFLVDMLIVLGGYRLSYILRLEQPELDFYALTFLQTLPWLLVIRFLCGVLVRQYTWAFRHASLNEAVSLVKAAAVGSILFVALCYLGGGFFEKRPPHSVFAFEFAFSLFGFGFVRFLPQYAYQQFLRHATRLAPDGEARLRTLVYGAGHTGAMILRDLLRTRVYPYKVIGFIDDDPVKWNTSIHGVRVLGSLADLPELIRRHEIDKILVAVPDLPGAQVRRLVDVCADQHIRFKIVPPYAHLVAAGEAAPLTLQDLRLEDLLDRQPVAFDHTRMAEFFVGKTVLVTGAAGSIGAELCRQIARQGAKRLLAFDLNENDLYFLQLELRDLAPGVDLRLEVGSVRDAARLESLFARYRPAIVYHAAAHKHVPLMEHCPAEAVKNNLFGTQLLAACAHRFSAESFVLISTDKAVRPSSVMGATKRLCEFLVHERARTSETRFMAVRFGNVLGSNGSLVQILQRQIAKGGPVTVTHPKITRFFMTIPEAVGLVLVASVQSEGHLCVLDMGEPLSVDRLAREMISLHGLIPDKDIPIVYTGLRPGEKMYEELFSDAESLRPSAHPRIRLADFGQPPFPVEEMLREAEAAVADGSDEAVNRFLLRHVPGYHAAAEAAAPPAS